MAKFLQKIKHTGACSPMTKASCTPRRKALARRLKPGGDLYRGKKKKSKNVGDSFIGRYLT